MVKARIWLTAISGDWEFIVSKRKLIFGGRVLEPGSPFDKSLVSTRRLRQLYESRRIVKDEKRSPSVAKKAKPTEPPVKLPEDPIKLDTSTIETPPEPEEEIPYHMPRIVETPRGGWFNVIANGKQIGKSTRDRAVAEKRMKEYADEL